MRVTIEGDPQLGRVKVEVKVNDTVTTASMTRKSPGCWRYDGKYEETLDEDLYDIVDKLLDAGRDLVAKEAAKRVTGREQ
jgi:hypothetical protein